MPAAGEKVRPAPGRRKRPGLAGRIFGLLSSPKLAIAELVGVLVCCLIGVTVFRGARAWELIFSTLWFNGLLVLLAVSSAAAFFSRIWRRKATMISVGMIVFHLSFLCMLGGIAFNSLFYFRGVLRLTEGETLPNSSPGSYDTAEHGRFFDFQRLRGETTLVRMHAGYKVNGLDKRAAYEIAVGDNTEKIEDTIYVAHGLNFDGIRFFNSKEGYSLLVFLADKDGNEQYGAYVPLQSLKQADGSFVYATGTKAGPNAFPFPAPPANPAMQLQLAYRPDPALERAGAVMFQTWPAVESAGDVPEGPGGQAALGETFDAGDFKLTAREVRYWVGMDVRYDPGLATVLTSLCFGLAGMVVTFIGRLRLDAARRRTVRPAARAATDAPAGEIPLTR